PGLALARRLAPMEDQHLMERDEPPFYSPARQWPPAQPPAHTGVAAPSYRIGRPGRTRADPPRAGPKAR
ncbi:hypothetical protein ACFWN5_40370, partial [Streptomyces sp. NPDC058430]